MVDRDLNEFIENYKKLMEESDIKKTDFSDEEILSIFVNHCDFMHSLMYTLGFESERETYSVLDAKSVNDMKLSEHELNSAVYVIPYSFKDHNSVFFAPFNIVFNSVGDDEKRIFMLDQFSKFIIQGFLTKLKSCTKDDEEFESIRLELKELAIQRRNEQMEAIERQKKEQEHECCCHNHECHCHEHEEGHECHCKDGECKCKCHEDKE